MMKRRDLWISFFVVVWLAVFHYESIRHFYLQPHFQTPLPKMKFLYPPAGWIMFFNVDDRYGFAEVYGVKNGQPQKINPHDILKTRFIGFDMVQRNVLSTVLDEGAKPGFCRALSLQFPEFKQFYVSAVEYPHLVQSRYDRQQAIIYQCP